MEVTVSRYAPVPSLPTIAPARSSSGWPRKISENERMKESKQGEIGGKKRKHTLALYQEITYNAAQHAGRE